MYPMCIPEYFIQMCFNSFLSRMLWTLVTNSVEIYRNITFHSFGVMEMCLRFVVSCTIAIKNLYRFVKLFTCQQFGRTSFFIDRFFTHTNNTPFAQFIQFNCTFYHIYWYKRQRAKISRDKISSERAQETR